MLEILSLNTGDMDLARYMSIPTESSKKTKENFYNVGRGVSWCRYMEKYHKIRLIYYCLKNMCTKIDLRMH